MIIAGIRPPEYDAALRAERARRAAEAEEPDTVKPESPGPERSAIEIAPRTPSD